MALELTDFDQTGLGVVALGLISAGLVVTSGPVYTIYRSPENGGPFGSVADGSDMQISNDQTITRVAISTSGDFRMWDNPHPGSFSDFFATTYGSTFNVMVQGEAEGVFTLTRALQGDNFSNWTTDDIQARALLTRMLVPGSEFLFALASDQVQVLSGEGQTISARATISQATGFAGEVARGQTIFAQATISRAMGLVGEVVRARGQTISAQATITRVTTMVMAPPDIRFEGQGLKSQVALSSPNTIVMNPVFLFGQILSSIARIGAANSIGGTRTRSSIPLELIDPTTVRIPHLSVPLKLRGERFSAHEQNSDEEVGQCVESILRTPIGSRLSVPQFGIPTLEFSPNEDHIPEIINAITLWEPRAQEIITETGETLVEFLAREYILRIESEGLDA